MRSIGSLVGLLVVAAIAGLIYKFYFSQGQQSAAISHPVETVNIIAVKNDLVAIAQAEQTYQAGHNSYASLDELVSSGAMALKKFGRNGYTYEAEPATDTFTVIARCPATTVPGCTNYSIDQNMEVQSVP